MTEADLDRAARDIAEARRTGRQIPVPAWKLMDHGQVYRLQDKVVAAIGEPLGGWKVGARAPGATPTCAPLIGAGQASPAQFDPDRMHAYGIECEISFRLGRDLPARAAAVSADEALAAIASAHPTLEIVDTRLADHARADALWLLADNQMNHGLVIGPAWTGWRTCDWARQPVKLTVNGEVIEDKQGGLASVDPLPVVTWLVDHVVRQRGGLRAGQLVTTGSWTGLRYTTRGARVTAAFAGIGEAVVTF